jgi:RNA polymerase sigma-70 factor, ECF subfamily
MQHSHSRFDFHRVDVAQFRAADNALFSALYVNVSPSLAGIARRFGFAPIEVELAVQDTWVRAFEHRSSWRGDGNLFRWLEHICRSVCVDQIRLRNRDRLTMSDGERFYSDAAVESSVDAISDELRSQAFGDWIDDQIKSFPASQRNAAALRWLLRWPVRRIAQTLDVSPGTVKTELFRARQVIARRLRDPQIVAALGIDRQMLDGYLAERG